MVGGWGQKTDEEELEISENKTIPKPRKQGGCRAEAQRRGILSQCLFLSLLYSKCKTRQHVFLNRHPGTETCRP